MVLVRIEPNRTMCTLNVWSSPLVTGGPGEFPNFFFILKNSRCTPILTPTKWYTISQLLDDVKKKRKEKWYKGSHKRYQSYTISLPLDDVKKKEKWYNGSHKWYKKKRALAWEMVYAHRSVLFLYMYASTWHSTYIGILKVNFVIHRS